MGRGPIRVLHVDDEPGVAETTAALLEERDDRFEAVSETDGEAALDRLDEHSFDCVISDYDMPRIDGLELLARWLTQELGRRRERIDWPIAP